MCGPGKLEIKTTENPLKYVLFIEIENIKKFKFDIKSIIRKSFEERNQISKFIFDEFIKVEINIRNTLCFQIFKRMIKLCYKVKFNNFLFFF